MTTTDTAAAERDEQTGELTLAGLIAELQRMQAEHPGEAVRISVSGKKRAVSYVYHSPAYTGENGRHYDGQLIITHV